MEREFLNPVNGLPMYPQFETPTKAPTEAQKTGAVVSKSVVYFVEIGKHVKIGVSRNFPGRLKSFLTAAPTAKALVTVPGDRALERRIHSLLAESRIARELFRPDWRVMEFAEQVTLYGLERALQWLEDTQPPKRAEQKRDAHQSRILAARQEKAIEDAYFASLVAQRKQNRGW